MRKQPSRRFKAAYRTLMAAVLLGMALALLPLQASGAPPDKPCKPNERKGITCEQPNPVPGGNTVASLHGDEIWDQHPRECVAGNLTDLGGNFFCDTGLNQVQLSFHEFGEPAASNKRLAGVCSSLNAGYDWRDDTWHHDHYYVDSYTYGWTESCSTGTCNVEVRLVITDSVYSITSTLSDRVEIILFGEANVPEGTGNPFEGAIDIEIHSIEADFKKPGTMRTAVTCNWGPLDPGWVDFSSAPQE